MKKKLIILTLFMQGLVLADSQCTLINNQCDNSPTKVVNGITFTLAEECRQLGLSGKDCCWNNPSQYSCDDNIDTCDSFRKNTHCTLIENICIKKDYISGSCQQFQSKYNCSDHYRKVDTKVCTNVVCANNESGTAAKCYSPPKPSTDNTGIMGNVIAYLQMGQNMAQNMNCTDNNHPENCTLFSGKYFNCYMYKYDAAQPGSFNNNGADCQVNNGFFNSTGVPTGYSASDHNLYSQATSGTNSVVGSVTNYSLSNDDTSTINNTVSLNSQGKAPVTNQDQHINYTPNSSKNPKINVNNGQVVSVTINKDAAKDLAGFTSFKDYLSDASVNLAWNRLKAEPDPNNVKNITFSDLGVSRRSRGKSFAWNTNTYQPVINGLCVHLADSCEGGDDSATVSDLIKGQLSYAGGWTNPNFCAKCTSDLFGACLTGEPRNTKQEWCCFNSKVAMDINLAAYDQGLINLYTDNGSRYEGQVNRSGNICGGVTVGMISQIDFSKANYFKDLVDSIDINQIIDNSNFTNINIQGNTSNRSNVNATGFVDEWKKKNGN